MTREKPYSTDRNLLHISYEGGVLEDPWREPYEDMFVLSVAPERAMLQVAVDESQRDVTGTARLKLYKGNAMVAGRKSARSLYNPEVATFEDDAVYRQADAEGFIRLNALRLRIRALIEKR